MLETVNTVLRVYDAATGAPLINPIDLNTFYGFPARFNRATGEKGQYLTDPLCIFDEDSGRWFHTVTSANVNATTANGDFLGPSYLEVAVSDTWDPTGTGARSDLLFIHLCTHCYRFC